MAVAAVTAGAYEKVAALPETEPIYRNFLWATAALSVVAGVVSLISFGHLAGIRLPAWLGAAALLLLIGGTAAVSVGIVVITINY